jgi:hypothetical protein
MKTHRGISFFDCDRTLIEDEGQIIYTYRGLTVFNCDALEIGLEEAIFGEQFVQPIFSTYNHFGSINFGAPRLLFDVNSSIISDASPFLSHSVC